MEERFLPVPRPGVTYTGIALDVRGKPLIDLVEVTASEHFYRFQVTFPQSRNYFSGKFLCNFKPNGKITMQGQLPLGQLFANAPPIVPGRKVTQLCPSGMWGLAFNLPGAIDVSDASFIFKSNTLAEVTVKKELRAAPEA